MPYFASRACLHVRLPACPPPCLPAHLPPPRLLALLQLSTCLPFCPVAASLDPALVSSACRRLAELGRRRRLAGALCSRSSLSCTMPSAECGKLQQSRPGDCCIKKTFVTEVSGSATEVKCVTYNQWKGPPAPPPPPPPARAATVVLDSPPPYTVGRWGCCEAPPVSQAA